MAQTHTIYVHAREAGIIASAGARIAAGAQVYKDDGMTDTFAHAMVVSNVSGTLVSELTVPAAGVSWQTVEINVQTLP